MHSHSAQQNSADALGQEVHAQIQALGRTDYERNHWLPHQLLQFPAEFRPGLLAEFDRLIRVRREVEATMLFYQLRQRLTPFSLSLASSDAEVVAVAHQYADQCAGLAGTGRGPAITYLYLAAFARSKGLNPPTIEKRVTPAVAVAKMCDHLWWRRTLRVVLARAVEHEARGLGLVSRVSGLYVSDSSFERWSQQSGRNRRTLEELVAVNELGEELPLAELSKQSVSEPRIRRAELMTRIAGFEAYAAMRGDVAVMFTVTTPSRMHARLAAGGKHNPSFDGTSPGHAQEYLCRLWAAARAAMHRTGLRPYGFRIAEPQHDGTPHWHLLLFLAAKELLSVRAILREYALAEDGDEPGAALHRVHEVLIDRSKGSAAGYVAKYISKNVDGEHLEAAEPGARARAQRVRAWASIWGIRQFQQIGGPLVTLWRELRRAVPANDDLTIRAAACAADRGDWCGFTEVMGGPQCRRAEAPLALYKRWDARPGRYGLPVGWVIAGVMSSDTSVATRLHTWTIRPASSHETYSANGVPGQASLRLPEPRGRPLESCQ